MALSVGVVYIKLSEYLVPRKYLDYNILFDILTPFFPTWNIQWDDVNEVSWF